VEATLSASRSKVATSSTVGKIAKSSGFRTENTAITIINDSAMLNVKSTSSTNGGSGSTTIASSASTPTGMPTPRNIKLRSEGVTTVVSDGMPGTAIRQASARAVATRSMAGSTCGGSGRRPPWRRATFSCQTYVSTCATATNNPCGIGRPRST